MVMINDDEVVLGLFAPELKGKRHCAVYGRGYFWSVGGKGWVRAEEMDASSGSYLPLLSVAGDEGKWETVVSDQDLLTHIARKLLPLLAEKG